MTRLIDYGTDNGPTCPACRVSTVYSYRVDVRTVHVTCCGCHAVSTFTTDGQAVTAGHYSREHRASLATLEEPAWVAAVHGTELSCCKVARAHGGTKCPVCQQSIVWTCDADRLHAQRLQAERHASHVVYTDVPGTDNSESGL